MKALHVVGVDTGLATAGIGRIKVVGRNITATHSRLVKTKAQKKDARGRRISAAMDEDRRMAEVAAALCEVLDAGPCNVLAYEVYRPFKRDDEKNGEVVDGFKAAHGRMVAMSVGLVVGVARSRGIVTVGIEAAHPKRVLGVQGKAGVYQRLCARIEGFRDLVGEDKGYHKSDAFGLAYDAMVQVFKAQLGAA